MSKIFAVSILLALATAVFADIDDRCLQCICNVESNCKPIGCEMDMGSLSCGYYQIKDPYWNDCGRPGDSLAQCGDDKPCAEECVHAYLRRYGTYCTGGRDPTCEDYARIHNGGPNGCHEDYTIPYWQKVKACYG